MNNLQVIPVIGLGHFSAQIGPFAACNLQPILSRYHHNCIYTARIRLNSVKVNFELRFTLLNDAIGAFCSIAPAIRSSAI
jgi:hypothetical protein